MTVCLRFSSSKIWISQSNFVEKRFKFVFLNQTILICVQLLKEHQSFFQAWPRDEELDAKQEFVDSQIWRARQIKERQSVICAIEHHGKFSAQVLLKFAISWLIKRLKLITLIVPPLLLIDLTFFSQGVFLSVVGYFGENVKNFAQIFNIQMVLGRTKCHEIHKVATVIRSERQWELLEDLLEVGVGNEVLTPILAGTFAFEAKTVQLLRLDTVPTEQLQNSC